MEKKPTKKRKLRFASRLFLSVFFLYLGFVVSFLLFQYKKEYDQAQHQLNSQLVNYNHELYELTKEMGDPRKAASKLLHIIPQKDLRVTIIDSFGKVLFDNHLDGDLENHYNRKEVREARDGKNAFAVRVSASEKIFIQQNNLTSLSIAQHFLLIPTFIFLYSRIISFFY